MWLRGVPSNTSGPGDKESAPSNYFEESNMFLLSAAQAARMLQVEVSTLTKWRSQGTGPAWHRIGGPEKGAIRYSPADLAEFITAARGGV